MKNYSYIFRLYKGSMPKSINDDVDPLKLIATTDYNYIVALKEAEQKTNEIINDLKKSTI